MNDTGTEGCVVVTFELETTDIFEVGLSEPLANFFFSIPVAEWDV